MTTRRFQDGDRALRYVEQVIRDSTRASITALLLDGADPEVIEALAAHNAAVAREASAALRELFAASALPHVRPPAPAH